MIPIPPHSVFSTPQFASFSLLILDRDIQRQNAVKEIREGGERNRGDSSSSSWVRMCRGEPTILVASANAFISEELCFACLDELHEFLATSRQTRLNFTQDTDGGVVVDWYRSRSTGLALCYMLIQSQGLIQGCIPWLHPSNSTSPESSFPSRLSPTSLRLQGLVLCVGVSGSNQFFSVFLNTLPSRMHQALSLLTSIFAVPITATRGDTATSQKEHADVQTPHLENSSSSLGKTQIRWMEALLASLVEEEEDRNCTNESSQLLRRRQPKHFAVSEKKGGVDTAEKTTAVIRVVGAEKHPTTSTASSTNRSRMEVEQMEIIGIHNTTMPKKSILASLAQQQEYYSPKPQSNKRIAAISLPSLHGFDYIPPEVLPPITVLTTSSSTTNANHTSYLYHNTNTKNITTGGNAQKPTWNHVSSGYKYPLTNNSKISEDISSCNSTTSPASEITTPTTATATMFHPTSSTSTMTLSNPLAEVEQANHHHKIQQNHFIQQHLNGGNSAETTAIRKENSNGTKASQWNGSSMTSRTPTSSPPSHLQHNLEKENVRTDPSKEITTHTATALNSNETVPRDKNTHPEESRNAKYSFKITAETSMDTSITTNENSIPIISCTPKDMNSTLEEDALCKEVRETVVVSPSIPSSNEISSPASTDALTTDITINDKAEASTAIRPIALDTFTLTVSVALNEDIVCSFYNSKLLHCHVNGLVQLHVTTKSETHKSPTDAPAFVVVIKDPSQQIYALKASQEYATDVGNGDDKFLYLVRSIPQGRFVPLLKYKCNDNLCPIPLRIQMKSRIVKESFHLRLSLQISSNPDMKNVLSDLDVIVMNIPSSITLDATTPKGGKFDSDQSTVSWNIPKLNAGEKIQLHAYFQNPDDEPPDLSSLPVSVRCFGLYSQLSDIQVRLRDAAAVNAVDSPRLDFKMKLARRFRVLHQEQQIL